MRNLNPYVYGITLLVVTLTLAACQPVQAIDPATVSQSQPVETATEKDDDSAPIVPKEVLDLEGSYFGSWTLYGVDEEGNEVELASWTDTIKAEAPQVDGDQAFVLTTTEMAFEGSDAPAMEFPGKEGYFLMPDGSLGDYFVETFGQISKSTQAGENVWITVTPASPEDLAAYPLPNVSSGEHALVKVVTSEDGVEVHRITRVTTVNWVDQTGQEQSSQFVSLQGFHKRQSE